MYDDSFRLTYIKFKSNSYCVLLLSPIVSFSSVKHKGNDLKIKPQPLDNGIAVLELGILVLRRLLLLSMTHLLLCFCSVALVAWKRCQDLSLWGVRLWGTAFRPFRSVKMGDGGDYTYTGTGPGCYHGTPIVPEHTGMAEKPRVKM